MHKLLIFLFLSCSDDTKQNQEDTDLSEEVEPLVLEELFVIPERPFDMTWDTDGSMLISADASGKLYRWDGILLEEEQGTYNDIQSVHVFENTLYYTTTDNGVTGALYGNNEDPLITQSSDGTLLRWPVDVTTTSTGEVLIADYNAGVVFSYEEDGSAQIYSVGSQTPLSLVWLDNTLYIGGEDGIWQKEWPNGIATLVDERSANGLINYEGIIYASNSQDGIFILQGNATPLPDEIGRPSTLLVQENMLYVIDQVGRGIWQTSL
jgi:WD40 repeat protein